MWSHRIVFAVWTLLLTGCKEDTQKLDPQLMEDGKKVAGYLAEKADEEKNEHQGQIQQLERKIGEVQSAIAAGDYDKAEAKVVDIYWKPPHPGMLTEGEKALMKQYDERRQALSDLIKRKRTPPASP